MTADYGWHELLQTIQAPGPEVGSWSLPMLRLANLLNHGGRWDVTHHGFSFPPATSNEVDRPALEVTLRGDRSRSQHGV